MCGPREVLLTKVTRKSGGEPDLRTPNTVLIPPQRGLHVKQTDPAMSLSIATLPAKS